MKQDLIRLEQYLTVANTLSNNLQTDKSQYQSEKQQLQADKQELQDKVTKLKNQKSQEKSQIEDFQLQLQSLQNELASTTEENETLETQYVWFFTFGINLIFDIFHECLFLLIFFHFFF